MHSKIAYFPVSTFSLIPYIPEKVAGNYQSFKAVTLGVVAKEVGHLWTSFCSLKWANSPLNRIHTNSVFWFFFFEQVVLKPSSTSLAPDAREEERTHFCTMVPKPQLLKYRNTVLEQHLWHRPPPSNN